MVVHVLSSSSLECCFLFFSGTFILSASPQTWKLLSFSLFELWIKCICNAYQWKPYNSKWRITGKIIKDSSAFVICNFLAIGMPDDVGTISSRLT